MLKLWPEVYSGWSNTESPFVALGSHEISPTTVPREVFSGRGILPKECGLGGGPIGGRSRRINEYYPSILGRDQKIPSFLKNFLNISSMVSAYLAFFVCALISPIKWIIWTSPIIRPLNPYFSTVCVPNLLALATSSYFDLSTPAFLRQ